VEPHTGSQRELAHGHMESSGLFLYFPFCIQNLNYCFPLSQGDSIDYQKQLKQMIKDLAKEKDKTEKELPKMSQV
jgi:hypothetical protein